MEPGRGETICPAKHCCYKRSFISLINVAVIMEQESSVGRLETKVYIKPTNTGLLLHYHSHVDKRYERSLITTMLSRAYRLSSSWLHFSNECERLKTLFDRLKYPRAWLTQLFQPSLINSTKQPTKIQNPANRKFCELPCLSRTRNQPTMSRSN